MKLNRSILRKMILNEIRQLREGDPMFPRLEKFVDDKYHELTSGESSDPVVSKVQDILNRNSLKYDVKKVPFAAGMNPFDKEFFTGGTMEVLKDAGMDSGTTYYIQAASVADAGKIRKLVGDVAPNVFYEYTDGSGGPSGKYGNKFTELTVFFKGSK